MRQGGAVAANLHLGWQHVRVTRPLSLVGAAMEVLLGAHLSGAGVLFAPTGCIAIAVALILASAQTFNDLHDEPADRVIGKDRPIARGFVRRRSAWLIAAATMTAGVSILLATTFILAVLIAVFLAILSIGYSIFFKPLPIIGNITAAALSAAPMMFGSYTGAGVKPTCAVTFLFFLLFLFIYEVVKTMRDEQEDALAGLRTIATSVSPGSLRILLWTLAVPIVSAAGLCRLLAPTSSLVVGLLLALGVSFPTALGLFLVTGAGRPSASSFTWAVRSFQLCWLPALSAFWLVTQPVRWPW